MSVDYQNKSLPWLKKILYPGKGDVPNFGPGCKVLFHFKTVALSDKENIIDDSRQLEQPMELILGKKFKLEVWEECVKTMKVQEISTFTVSKEVLLSYPIVSKSLRNIKDKIETPSHCCGMASKSLGYPDLDKLIDKPEDLMFTFELLKVDFPGEYEKESWAMSDEEKLESIPKLKAKGNDYYLAKEYDLAEKQYFEALGRIEQMMLREKPEEEEWLKLEEVKVPLLLNYSQCKLLQKQYYAVIEHTNTILSRHPDNIKALFRRGKAHVGAWNPDEATCDFHKVLELDESLSTLVKNELKNLENLKRKKHDEDKQKLAGKMFGDL